MSEKMVFGQYYATDSLIHKLDPRCKIITLLLYMVIIFIIDNLYVLLGAFGFTLIIVFLSKVPIIKFLNSLKMIMFLLIFTCFFQIIFNQNGTIIKTFEFTLTYLNLVLIIILLILYFLSGKFIKKFRLVLFIGIVLLAFYLQYSLTYTKIIVPYSIHVYDAGLFTALKVVIRIVNLIFISSLLTLSTKPTDLNNALEDLMKPLKYIGVKTTILSMMISIALRFIPTLINEADKILKAQASRGVDFNEGSLKAKVIQIISLLIPMFVVSYKRAEDLSYAMEARGYDPDGNRTRINELKYQGKDVVAYCLMNVLLILTIIFKVIYEI